MNNIIQFHIDNNYYVNVKSLPNMIGCFVNFPPNLLQQQPELNLTYIIGTSPYQIEKYVVTKGKDIQSHTVKSTKSSTRLLVLEDVLLLTLDRKIAQKLIVVNDKMGNSIFNALELPMDEEDYVIEKELLLKFRNLILGKVDRDIVDPSIAEGYRLVLNCFESGGL